ncbi:MAG TPA: glycosyltransferase family 1 protein [Bryobacteraceae bacterium]|jgi:glycosyltransferase involved in cell wall biosynthesis|nr:glycosyltransferase family 1 protein [Bryobacteraceae bacterium]
MFRRLAINGKFLTAGPTGVHRVAKQLLGELANHRGELAEIFDESPRLIAPSSLRNKATPVFEVESGGIFRGQLWEQLDLPRLSRRDLLLNLCNLGPVASRFAITMIHDAQVFITSDSYSWAFANWYRRVLPAIGHRHSRILTVSEFSANQLAQHGVAQRDRITVITNGVDHLLACDSDPEILSRLRLVPRKFVVGLANVQVHKNVGLLLKAFAAPELADLRLVLVGAASRAQFELLGHPVSPNVVFAGQICDRELRALLESALCLGFPSTTEGFGLPPLEGMLFGCPAIMAPCGALPEIAGEAGLFASPDEPRQWIGAIRKLADEPNHWLIYSHAGRARASQFTWKRSGQKLIDVIREVAVESATNHRRHRQ